MSIVIVDTNFVVHKEDEAWTAEEMAMIEEHLIEEKSGVYQTKKRISPEIYAQIAERLSKGDATAWELMDAHD